MKRIVWDMAAMLVISVLGPGAIKFCHADMIYLKNGRVMEGEVRRTEKGLWIEGALFAEDEIERIEKGPEKDVKEPDTKPWYIGLLEKVGIKSQEQGQTETGSPASATVFQRQRPQWQNQQSQVPGQPKQGLPFLGPQPATVPYGSDFSEIIKHAEQLQDEAMRRQETMIEEMQKAEEGYYETYKQDMTSDKILQEERPRSYDYDYEKNYYRDINDQKQIGQDYDYQKEQNRGNKFKKIEIDDYGNVSWE